MLRIKLLKKLNIKALTSVGFAVIVGAVGYTILSQSSARPAAPAIYMTPETLTVAANATVSVSVYEDSGSNRVLSAGVQFNYPQNLLDFVSIDSSASPFVSKVASTGGNGTVTIARGTDYELGQSGALTGPQLLGVVTFKAKATSGTANLTPLLNGSTQLVTATDFNDSSSYVNLINSSSRLQGSVVTIDASPPSVSLSGISNSQSLSSVSTVPVTITATDNTGVKTLEIYVDGNKVATPTLSGTTHTYQWNLSGLSLGNHTFQAKATDNYGNTGQSPIVTITVSDKTPPTVSLSPVASPVAGTVTLSATANDIGGGSVTKVEFYAGNTKIGEDTTSPYSIQWNTKSGSFPDGSYSLTAKAYDNASPTNIGVSSPITVVVENEDKIPPTTPSNLRVTGTTTGSISLAWNASTDNVGVTGYKISRNGVVLTTVGSTSFTDSNLAANTSYTYTIVAVDAAGNTSTTPAAITAVTLSYKVSDLNKDGVVDQKDLAYFINKYGSTDATCDLNKDGSVDLIDLAIFIFHYKE